MSGTAVDNVLQRLRKHTERHQPGEALAKFLVTKLSWRGNYRRILAITATSIVTLHPETLVLTNAWAFTGDHDISFIDLGVGDHPDGSTFILHFRKDKKGLSSRDAKFACADRASLLTVLYDQIAYATARGICGAGPTLLGESQTFQAFKLRRGQWIPVSLRVTCVALERLDATGKIKWHWRYVHAAAPAIRLLASSGGPPGTAAFALISKRGQSPRVYAARDQEFLVKTIQSAALRCLGIALAIDSSGDSALSGPDMLSMVAAAERERASTTEETPLGEWEVLRVRRPEEFSYPNEPFGDLVSPISSTVATSRPSSISSTGLSDEVVPRRLVLTPNGILERRLATYEIAEWRQLPAIAALVRYIEDPQCLGIEWRDGVTHSVYITPARDALLSGILYAAQAAAGRPIPVLADPTDSGNVLTAVRSQAFCAPATIADAEVERITLGHVAGAAEQFLSAGGAELSLNALALAGLTAAVAPDVKYSAVGSSELAIGGAGSEGEVETTRVAAIMERRMREFNASVPYAGVIGRFPSEDATTITALLSYLPKQHAAGSQPTLSHEEARIVILSLQCLQRLASSPSIATQIVGASGGAGRIFAALLSRHEHVAAEAARLLYRFFAPAQARAGASPWAIDAAGAGSLISAHDDAAVARATKSVCFISNARCASLLTPLLGSSSSLSSSLLSGVLMEVIAAVVCKPGAKTTELSTRETLLQEVAALGRPLFGLFNHPARQAADAAAMVMGVVAEGGAVAAAPMREAALAEGAVLHHLLRALGPEGPRRQLSRELVSLWADSHDRTLSMLRRALPPGLMHFLNEPKPKKKVTLLPTWRLGPPDRRSMLGSASGHVIAALSSTNVSDGQESSLGVKSPRGDGVDATRDALLPKTAGPPSLPQGVASLAEPSFIDSVHDPLQTSRATAKSSHGDPTQGDGPPPPQGMLSPRSLVSTSATTSAKHTLRANWDAFWVAISKDHNSPSLIWNERTRSELREALQTEENLLRLGRQRVGDVLVNNTNTGDASTARTVTPPWNADEFQVTYASVDRQLCIGGVYVKLLLDGADPDGVKSLPDPKAFFTALHLQFLRLGDATSVPGGSAQKEMAERELCVRAMAVTYAAHAATIGLFEGTKHLLRLMDTTPSRPLRQYILQLLYALVRPQGLGDPVSGTGAEDNAARRLHCENEGTSSTTSTAAVSPPADPLQRSTESSGRQNEDDREEKTLIESIARENAGSLVAAGGVEVLVDMVAAAHEATERPAAAATLDTLFIASASHADEVKVWYYLPSNVIDDVKGLDAAAVKVAFEEHRVGPVTKAEIRQLLSRNTISFATPFWAPGMAEPVVLGSLRELRWWTATGRGPFTPFQAAEVALRVLTALVTLRPAAGVHRGRQETAMIPLPLAHRAVGSARCLSHIAQVVLTGEPGLVAAASNLILLVLEHNLEGMSLLYRTGIFFFLLAYCGSNLLEASNLLRAAHLRQAHRGGMDAQNPALTLAQRSFLGDLLPESLIYTLDSYGAEAFAAALAGDADTPELIWTHRMRGQRLVPQILRHIGDLPRRLAERCVTTYEYTPCPPIGYPELTDEVFCHRYYLRHLCDEGRFPKWPLVEHVRLLQAILEGWRGELARKPLGLTTFEAARELELDPEGKPEGITEEDMKAAYRRLARQFHPDRNPEGRERFERVRKAYERLQAAEGAGDGPQPWRILLFLRAQCILYRRCTAVLQHYKYAGYPLLLAAAEAPPIDQASGRGLHFLSPEIAPRLHVAVELCWLTCAASKLNAEELARSGGVTLLGGLLDRCVSIMPMDVPPTDPAAVLATQALRAFACIAAFGIGRSEIEKAHEVSIIDDVLRAVRLERVPAATDAALQCAVQMCRSSGLQRTLLEHGALGYFLPLLLQYDATLDDAGTAPLPSIFDPEKEGHKGPDFLGLGPQKFAIMNAQAARNHHAMLAARVLSALAGYTGAEPATAECLPAQEALSGVLTEALAPRLAEKDPRTLLTDLSSSVATPAAVWNGRMREELLDIAVTLRERSTATQALQGAAKFKFESLRGELLVAGVFVRLFAEQPTFQLKDPVGFCKGLVTAIHGIVGQPTAADETNTALRLKHLVQCVAAVRGLLDANPRIMGVLATRPALDPLLSCIRPVCELGHSGPLWPAYTVLSTSGDKSSSGTPLTLPSERRTAALESFVSGRRPFPDSEDTINALRSVLEAASATWHILVALTAHAGCLQALATERCVMQALWIVHRPPCPDDALAALRLLHALAGDSTAAWTVVANGGVFYLMSCLLPERVETNDERRAAQEAIALGAAAVLNRVAAHPLHGQRAVLWLAKLLPPGLVAAVQDGPSDSTIVALAQSSETPERIWTTEMRQATAVEAAHLAAVARVAQAGRKEAQFAWSPGEDYVLQHHLLQNEVFVGGVYVRLFLKTPGHSLRNPQGFLEGLLERHVALLLGTSPLTVDDVNMVVLLGAAAVAAIQHYPALADHGVRLGYVSKLIKALSSRVPPPPPHPSSASNEQAALPVPGPADDVSGSALRLVHALAAGDTAGEALARCAPPAVPVLMGALQWGGAASVLAVETLKRGLAATNRSRDLLVGAALAAGLLPELLRRLDWREADQNTLSASLSDEASDAAVQRVLYVDVINLLSLEGAYSEQVRAILDASDVWAAYRGQRHDLFLPSTGTGRTAGVAGLLRGPEAARFTLPAPQMVHSPVESRPQEMKGGETQPVELETKPGDDTKDGTSKVKEQETRQESPLEMVCKPPIEVPPRAQRNDVQERTPPLESEEEQVAPLTAECVGGNGTAEARDAAQPKNPVESERRRGMAVSKPMEEPAPEPSSPPTMKPSTSKPESLSPTKAFQDPLSALK